MAVFCKEGIFVILPQKKARFLFLSTQNHVHPLSALDLHGNAAGVSQPARNGSGLSNVQWLHVPRLSTDPWSLSHPPLVTLHCRQRHKHRGHRLAQGVCKERQTQLGYPFQPASEQGHGHCTYNTITRVCTTKGIQLGE